MGTEDAVSSNSEVEGMTDLEKKIVKQVEYYFGNFNLSKDKFLKEKSKEDDGWISLETLITFNRLKQLSTDFAVITSALKKSQNNIIEINEDGKRIRRLPDNPLPEVPDFRKDIDDKTVYVKGLPTKSELEDLEDFFGKYGTIQAVTMRRNLSKLFKGSAFIVFATNEEAGKFMELENVKYNHVDLLREKKSAYHERKQLQFQQRKAEKEKKENGSPAKNASSDRKTESEVSEIPMEKGCVLKLSGLSENTTWEIIKEVFCPHGDIVYVDYRKGNPEGYVRFGNPIAAEVMEKVVKEEDGVKTVEICDAKVTPFVIEGDDEVQYWKKIAQLKSEMKKRANFKQGHRGSNHGKHFRGGGRKQFGKRHRFNDKKEGSKESGERPSKIQKTE